jgi:UPF0755 protein
MAGSEPEEAVIDDLDLVFDDDDRPRRSSHRAGDRRSGRGGQRPPGARGPRNGPPRRRPRKKKRTGLALFLSLLLLLVIGLGAFFGLNKVRDLFGAPDYTTTGTGTVVIEVKDGDTATAVGQTLYDKHVIKSVKAFTNAAKDNPQSTKIEVGFYSVKDRMPAKAALEALLARDAKGALINKVTNLLTVPEGKTFKDTLKLLADKTKIPLANFTAAAKDPAKLGVPDWWFTRTDGKKAAGSIEGFLFPDSYEIPPDATAQSILTMMVQRFLSVATDIGFVDTVQKDRGISPYEALIVASLAQAESGNVDDLGKIARVAYNRVYGGSNLKEEHYCQCLEMDVTVNYWRNLQGLPIKSSAEMTAKELDDPKNPYNRKLKGLVPGPINSPGKAALEAAMDPPVGDWLYFVASGAADGHSLFAATAAKHSQNCASVGLSC